MEGKGNRESLCSKRGARADCVDVVTDLATARSRWEALEARGSATPFQSFTWVSTLANTVGRSLAAETFVVIVREAASGRDLMLLPLVRRRLGPARIIEMPDLGVSDYNTPIIAPELMATPDRLPGIWKAAIASLPSADIIRINRIPDQIGQRANPLLSLNGAWMKETQSWCINLPDCWADYETHVLRKKLRGNLRRDLKRLEAFGTVSHVNAADEATAEQFFEAMCAHRAARFARLRRSNLLDDAAYRAFYRQLLKHGLASGLTSISALRVGAEIVATLLGLRWRGTYFALIPTMGALPAHGIGKLMNWFEIKEMHGRGCRYFDFTMGNELYKRDYGAMPRPVYEIVRPLKANGYPLAWAIKARAQWKRWAEPTTRTTDGVMAMGRTIGRALFKSNP
jgi:CelD/BcsL family acetyltransferase involved in cellulose biosynthesis